MQGTDRADVPAPRVPPALESRLVALEQSLAAGRSLIDVGATAVADGLTAAGAYAGGLLLCDGDELLAVAVRGYPAPLPGRYRRFPAASGTPVGHVVRTGAPVFVRSATELLARFPDTQVQESSRAWAAVPLRLGTQVLGALALAFDAPQGFDDEQRAFLLAVGDACSRAVAQTGLVEQLAAVVAEQGRTNALLRTVLTGSPLLVAFLDLDLRYLLVNDAIATFNGAPAAAHVGRTVAEMQPRLAPVICARVEEVFRTERPLLWEDFDDPATGASWLLSWYPVRSGDGTVFAVGVLGLDTTERRRLERDRADTVRALRRVLLPAALAQPAGTEVAARYVPARDDVGGDFYDAWQSPGSDALALLLGDAVGHGPAAGTTAVAVRHAVRAAARGGSWTVGDVVAAAHEALAAISEPETTVALTLAVLRPVDGGQEVSVVSLGGPPPLVLRLDGTVEELPVDGPPLGVLDDPACAPSRALLAPGDVLVLVTDGALDARAEQGPPARLGAEAVRSALTAARGGTAAEVADAVVRVVAAHTAGGAVDDLAVVAVRALQEPPASR